MKEAYLNACKWYATNVISKDEIRDVQVQFEKQNDSPSIVLRLFVTVEENWLKNKTGKDAGLKDRFLLPVHRPPQDGSHQKRKHISHTV